MLANKWRKIDDLQSVHILRLKKSSKNATTWTFFPVKAEMLLFSNLTPGGHQGGLGTMYFNLKCWKFCLFFKARLWKRKAMKSLPRVRFKKYGPETIQSTLWEVTRFALRLIFLRLKTHSWRRIMVVVLSMPSGVCSQVSPKYLGWEGSVLGDGVWKYFWKMEKWGSSVNFELDWWKSAWPILEFVTLRSEFCDTYFCVCDTHFRDLGGAKMEVHWNLKNHAKIRLEYSDNILILRRKVFLKMLWKFFYWTYDHGQGM